MENGTSTYTMIGEVIFFLLLILGLFYLIARLAAKRTSLFQSGRSIKTLGGVSLGPNKSMQVVEVGHRLFIVGIGDNVQLLDAITDAEEIAYIREHMTNQTNVKLDQLFSWTKRWQERRTGSVREEEWNDSPSFQQVFHDKMQKVAARKQMLRDQEEDDEDRRLND